MKPMVIVANPDLLCLSFAQFSTARSAPFRRRCGKLSIWVLKKKIYFVMKQCLP